MNEPISFEDEIAAHGRLIYPNKGTSMRPFIRQGRDLIVVSQKPAGRLRKYDVPLYRTDRGQYVLHRILKVRAQDYVICGDNNWKREFGIRDSQIVGVLTAIVRDGVTVPVTDRKYLLMVHLWCDFFPVRALIVYLLKQLRRFGRKLRG